MALENAFTIDVEDFYQVEAFSGTIKREDWHRFESRVVANTDSILDQLDTHGITATFFVLGCVAQQHPEVVRNIAQRGHEIASHGMSHKLIYRQEFDEFERETRDSKALLEDLSQQEVLGYRAATYSITRKSLWALDVIAETGFVYDSSIFPITHDRYGIPEADTVPGTIRTPGGATIVEFPISTVKTRFFNIPVAGGGYFRLFPYTLTRMGLRQINKRNQEFMFYLHPWEVDPGQPVIPDISLSTRFRHYVNISRCRQRLNRLFEDFRFTTMRGVLENKGLIAGGNIVVP
ncbi:MAG: DUF3473 domain-containing protein [Gammaproteobacteria bacterium]|jgi:polysaccharide deacetylase family protein (PEP-CTERM system associated)